MSNVGPSRITEPFFSSGVEGINLSEIHDPAVRRALEQLKHVAREQARIIGEWYQPLQYGPVPGAYFPLIWQWAQPAAGPFLPTGALLNHRLPCKCIGVAVTGWCLPTTETVGVSLVVPSTAVTIFTGSITGAGLSATAAADFASDARPSLPVERVRLDIDSVTGNVYRLSVILWCKNASRIEP